MSYLSRLGLHKEPFSTSPDPFFFYRTHTHRNALAKIEVAVRLRRGLSLILGDIGTGKTTLARTLVRSFSDDEPYEFYLIFDPGFQTEFQFLTLLGSLFQIRPPRRTTLDYKRAIENFLYEKNLVQGKSVVVIIDEAQKLSPLILETLRVFLNYETNEHKLIQLLLFSQLEIIGKLERMPNLCDRIGFKCFLSPLSLEEIQRMVEFRLQQAGWSAERPLFTPQAIELISGVSGGYLRKITLICHQLLVKLVVNGHDVVDEALVRSFQNEELEFAHVWRSYAGREVVEAH